MVYMQQSITPELKKIIFISHSFVINYKIIVSKALAQIFRRKILKILFCPGKTTKYLIILMDKVAGFGIQRALISLLAPNVKGQCVSSVSLKIWTSSNKFLSTWGCGGEIYPKLLKFQKFLRKYQVDNQPRFILL